MAIGRYVIAGLKVEMDVNEPLLTQRSQRYLRDFEGQPNVTMYIDEKINRIRAEHPDVTDEDFEYFRTCSGFYRKLVEFDGFMLHSSCLSYNGKAYLFTADSGTGKSTHTSLWCKYLAGVTIVNDDKPAVRMIDGKFYAMGTPWSGKSDLNTDIAVPIGGVACLSRGTVNTIQPSPPSQSVVRLLKQTLFPTKHENTDRLASLLDKFIRNIPVWSLQCDMSETAVKTSFEAMTGEKYFKGK